jgi:hypothetical protein
MMPTFPSPPLKLSGRTMAPCGLQIMPRFPSPSLKFRTVSFPQYGFKAGISDVACPARWFAIALRALCYHRVAPALCQGPMRLQAPPCELLPPLYPRGPRSGPGYVVPVHPRLTDPMRPTPRHIPISPPCDLYEMPSLCAYTTTPRQPTSGSVLSLTVLYRHVVPKDPGKFIGCSHPVPSPMTPAFDVYGKSRHFQYPHTPILVREPISGLNCSSLSLRPVDLLASLVGADRAFPSQPRLLLPGFRRIDHSHRRRISLRWQLGKFHRRDSHPLEHQLASLHPYGGFSPVRLQGRTIRRGLPSDLVCHRPSCSWRPSVMPCSESGMMR